MKKLLAQFAIVLALSSIALGINSIALAENGFSEGDKVQVVEGEYTSREGVIKSIDEETGQVGLTFDDSETIIDLDVTQVKKIFTPSDPLGQIDEILGGNKSGLNDFTGQIHKSSSIEPGADIITSVIFRVIDFMKYLIAALAVIFAIITGIHLVTSGKKIDEVSTKEKESLKLIIYGLILIIIADELVTRVFFGDYGECVASASNAKECAKAGGSLIKGIYSLILAVMGTVAIFIIVLSAFRMVTAYGNEETIKTEKNRIIYAIVGLIVAGLGEFVVKTILFPDNGAKGIDVAAAQKLVYNFTNFIAAFIGALAFGMLFYGGWLYVVSFGNDESTNKAKKIVISAVIGILIALSAFGIVRTLTTFSTSRTEIPLPGSVPGLPTTPK